MDAMRKRMMWKVAIAHFVLTALIIITAFFSSFSTSLGSWEGWQRFDNSYIWRDYLNNCLADVVFLLQPSIWLLSKIKLIGNAYVIIGILCIILIPIWSFCFGWIFTKLDNWLNHFPVLGRKVF